MTGKPLISVIMPTFNRGSLLIQTLQTLSRQTYPLDRFEVLVVIDGSDDGTKQMLDSLALPFNLRVFSQAHRGPAAARNLGLRNAEGEIILFLDDDIFVTEDLINQHALCHEKNEDLVVIGSVVPHPESPPSQALENLKEELEEFRTRFKQDGGLRFPEDSTCEANTSVRRVHLEAVGLYDERFYRQRENEELGYRLFRRGLRYLYRPEALAYHFFTKNDDNLIQDCYWWGHNYVLFCQKHPDHRAPSNLSKVFEGSLFGRLVRRTLWFLARPMGPCLAWTAKFLGFFYPAVNHTGKILPTARKFCSYSLGIQDAGWTLNDVKRNLYPR